MKQKAIQGFTLIELAVVVFITVLITTISVAEYREAEQRKKVVIARDMITQSLRSAQLFAITGRQTNNAVPTCRTPEYYSIRFQHVPTFSIAARNNCGTNDVIDNFTLPSGINIDDIGFDGGVAHSIEIRFYLPNGRMRGVRNNGPEVDFTSAQVIVDEDANNDNYLDVRINSLTGQIGDK